MNDDGPHAPRSTWRGRLETFMIVAATLAGVITIALPFACRPPASVAVPGPSADRRPAGIAGDAPALGPARVGKAIGREGEGFPAARR